MDYMKNNTNRRNVLVNGKSTNVLAIELSKTNRNMGMSVTHINDDGIVEVDECCNVSDGSNYLRSNAIIDSLEYAINYSDVDTVLIGVWLPPAVLSYLDNNPKITTLSICCSPNDYSLLSGVIVDECIICGEDDITECIVRSAKYLKLDVYEEEYSTITVLTNTTREVYFYHVSNVDTTAPFIKFDTLLDNGEVEHWEIIGKITTKVSKQKI